MISRVINLNDIRELKRIHDKFYKDEFEFPDFLYGFFSAFVIVDDHQKIITGGGIRPIAESIILTDKDYPIEKRREALQEVLRISIHTSRSSGFKELHAFVQDEKWMNHLRNYGFKDTRGKSLVLSF